MKEIVVISGKGGTGKTSITASFTVLGGLELIVADCDVDAADMHLLLQPTNTKSVNFYSGESAYIDSELCSQCGKCFDVCRFNAIEFKNNIHKVVKLSCEGCGYCARVCPDDAITNIPSNVGDWHISKIKTGSKMVHANLGIGEENSGKLVAKVKQEAKYLAEKDSLEWVLVDGSPGVGCPVVSSLSGASFVVLVTEPSVSGLHDLKRVYELVAKFNLKAGCIINKADINIRISDEIKEFLRIKGIIHLADLLYDEQFTDAMVRGETIIEVENHPLINQLTRVWSQIKMEA